MVENNNAIEEVQESVVIEVDSDEVESTNSFPLKDEEKPVIDFETLKTMSDEELKTLKTEIREKLVTEKDKMFITRYTLLYPSQDDTLKYDPEKYFKDLLRYLNVKLKWKEYEFLTLEQVYLEIKDVIALSSSKSKVKELPEGFIPWALSYTAIEGLYNLIYNNSGIGYSEVQERKYIFYPINNSWSNLYRINLELNNLNQYVIQIDDILESRIKKEVEDILTEEFADEQQ